MRRDELLAFQEQVIHALSGEHPVAGIDPGRLELVRDLAKAKRIAKVESVLPRTCHALGGELSRLANDFAHTTPPRSFRSRSDGLAFYRFLARRGAAPAILELAYCELAITALGTRSSRQPPGFLSSAGGGTIAIRRAPGVRLRTCQFDVRQFFEGDVTERLASMEPSPIHLAILADPLAGTPRITQLSPGLLEFLRGLRAWRVLSEAMDEEATQLLHHLQKQGLLEIALARE